MGTMREYTAHMRRRRLADGTIYARRRELAAWLGFIGDGWTTATRHDVERWADTTPDYTPRSMYTRLSHLHQFYRWAVREGLAAGDPTDLVDRPRVPTGLPRPAPLTDANHAIATAPTPVDLAMLLMVDGGLRCVEVSRLRWADVELERGVMFVHGKGNRHRYVGLPDRLRRALYLAQPDRRADTAPVIGVELTPARVSHRVNNHIRACGFGFTAHQLRHAYATRLYSATGGDLLMVQQALGHASLNSTQVYTQVDAGGALAAAQRLVA